MTTQQKKTRTIKLTYPPSVNTYWRSVNGRVILSAQGRAYRRLAGYGTIIANLPAMTGRVHLEILVCPPDRRRRDLDNVLKAILDALQYAGLYLDDSQVDLLTVRRGEVVPGGSISVVAEEVTDD